MQLRSWRQQKLLFGNVPVMVAVGGGCTYMGIKHKQQNKRREIEKHKRLEVTSFRWSAFDVTKKIERPTHKHARHTQGTNTHGIVHHETYIER
jgi:hypothetical protein